jgi:hypothetical protein
MKRAFFLICTSIITFNSAFCQTNASITNVDFRIENNKIVVVYSITGYQPGELFSIGLSFVTGDFKSVFPSSVYGDIGPDIPGGVNKSIVWNIEQDKFVLTGSLKAVVTILSSTFAQAGQSAKTQTQPPKKPLGGPGYAFLSMLLPGTGGYFVEANKTRAIVFNVVGGAVLISVISAGIQVNNLNKQYDAASPADKPAIQSEIDYAEQWFRDAGTAYALIWVTDVLWVAYKGGRNKYKQRTGTGMTINYSNNRLLAGYRVTF